METAYLLPLTAFCLVLALTALAFRANRRRGYGPFALGVLAAALLMLGKFVHDWNVSVYGAIASLIGASLWNSWPRSTTSVPLARADTLLQIASNRSDKHGNDTQD
jgi:hypothetical protein